MKNKAFVSILTIAILQISMVSNLSGATVHVIMFIMDDFSDKITASCQRDEKLMREEIRNVEKYTGMAIKYYQTSFNKQSVNQILSSLDCGPDDVILFYYSGHGYNLGNSDFPCIDLRNAPGYTMHVNLSDIHSRLKGKGARLVMSIGDCCNNVVGQRAPLSDFEKNQSKYKTLFLYTKGDFLITSSQKSQFSWGGCFTPSFLRALQESKNADWKDILEKAKLKTVAISQDKKQTPYFESNTSLIRGRVTHER